MINDLKRMNAFLVLCIAALFALSLYLIAELQETEARASDLSAQVYTLGSMLGERAAAYQAENVITEVNELD